MINKKGRNFFVVNSFSEVPFGGNPAGVFLDSKGLSSALMLKIAKQLNLVETVFVFSSDEKDFDFEIRYFMPEGEVPIAGHPTIAAFIALSEAGIIDNSLQKIFRIKTQKGIQKINLLRENPLIFSMQQIPPVFGDIIPKKEIAPVFGISEEEIDENLPCQIVDIGLGHVIVPLKSLESVLKVKRNIVELKALCEKYGAREAQIFSFETYRRDVDIHTRNICPREGIEDPACGNGNAAIGAYLMQHFYKERKTVSLRAEQGNVVDMPSIIEIYVQREGDNIQVSIAGGGVCMLKGEFFINNTNFEEESLKN